MFISHGLYEHMEYYQDLGEYLASRGVLVFGHDHRGFGRSTGSRNQSLDINQFVGDILIHVVKVMHYDLLFVQFRIVCIFIYLDASQTCRHSLFYLWTFHWSYFCSSVRKFRIKIHY